MRVIGRIMVLGVALVAAACVPKPQPEPEPAPPPVPAPTPAPTPPSPAPSDWADLPLTPGEWVYASEPTGSRAAFGTSPGQFTVRCERGARRILLMRAGGAGGSMTVRTSYGARALPLQAADVGAATAVVSASDPLLDQIAFSRGRFSVEVPGQPLLVIPAWPEMARVVEDCRI